MRNLIFILMIIISSILSSCCPCTKLEQQIKEAVYPIGAIASFGGNDQNIPAGWMLCDGRELNREEYSALFNAIGTNWGGQGDTKFNIPDLRGYFLRGVDKTHNVDQDADKRTDLKDNIVNDRVGSYQKDEFKSHTHNLNDNGHSHPFSYRTEGAGNPNNQADNGDNIGFHKIVDDNTKTSKANITIDDKGGKETRPKNAYVNYIIRVK